MLESQNLKLDRNRLIHVQVLLFWIFLDEPFFETFGCRANKNDLDHVLQGVSNSTMLSYARTCGSKHSVGTSSPKLDMFILCNGKLNVSFPSQYRLRDQNKLFLFNKLFGHL